MSKFHEKPFDDATKLKLSIFQDYFREWLPVFIHDRYVEKIYIYDLFAGRGKDKDGNSGSPLILLEEAKGQDCKHCRALLKKVCFIFNDKNEFEELEKNIKEHFFQCSSKNCRQNCKYDYQIGSEDFKEIFFSTNFKKVLSNKNYAKFILLDQFGFSQVDDSVFVQLVSAQKTDFIFFIASSFVNRFKEHEYTKKYIDTSKIAFEHSSAKEQHRLIADYFESLIPKTREYYIHHFTIKKGANYYGIIFGSKHSLGMEKILKVCWSKDEFSGESNENLYNDFEADTLFYDPEKSNKKVKVKDIIIENIFNKTITDNHAGLKFVLKNRCLPELFTQTVKELEKKGKITRSGDLNYASSNIHKTGLYHIEVL